jgi:DNA-binding response OmpR family regulator
MNQPVKHLCPHCGQAMPGALVVDLMSNSASRDGKRIKLRPAHAELLYALWVKPGHVIAPDRIAGAMWGAEWPDGWRNMLSIYISQLRPELIPLGAHIETINRRGYRLVIEETENERVQAIAS